MRVRRLMLAVVVAAWIAVAVKATCKVDVYRGQDPGFKAIWIDCGPFRLNASYCRTGHIYAISGRVAYLGL